MSNVNIDYNELVDVVLYELAQGSLDRKKDITKILDNVREKKNVLAESKRIAKEIDLTEAYIITDDELDQVGQAIKSIIKAKELKINTISKDSTISKKEDQSKISMLIQELTSLKTKNHESSVKMKQMENTIVQQNLEAIKYSERIMDQSQTIESLSKMVEGLKKQLKDASEMMKVLEKTSNTREDINSTHVVVSDLRKITNFTDMQFHYSIEYLNQYIESGKSIYTSKDVHDIVEKALHTYNHKLKQEHIYIVSMYEGKVFSRFDFNEAKTKIDNNPFFTNNKLNKKTVVSLITKDLNLINKTIYCNIMKDERRIVES